MSILVVNAGSSNLKLALFDGSGSEERLSGSIEWNGPRRAMLLVQRPGGPDRELSVSRAAPRETLEAFLAECARVDADAVSAAGHRVVHGGSRFSAPARVTRDVREALGDLAELAPLHNGPALEAIEALERLLPEIPQVAVFDTAFYSSLPPREHVYPLPYAWYERWGVRRFGFHGISHSYAVARAAEMLGRRIEDLAIVSCHLGNGCSATAVREGSALATTMGYTPMEGLMMGTRSGSIDPGILLELARRRGLSIDDLDHALNLESGLLGVSGVSGDYRRVEAAARDGNERARLAVAIYAERIRAAIGALAATLGGVDVLIFTGGVGEHSAALREKACDGLDFLGIRLDRHRNRTSPADADVSADASPARILAIRAREEKMIATEVAALAVPAS